MSNGVAGSNYVPPPSCWKFKNLILILHKTVSQYSKYWTICPRTTFNECDTHTHAVALCQYGLVAKRLIPTSRALNATCLQSGAHAYRTI